MGIAGVYCSYRSADTTAAILGSIVQQLAEPMSDLLEFVVDACKDPTISRLTKAFANILLYYAEINIVVDALDECNSGSELLKELRKICDIESNFAIRVLITSRTGILDIQRALGSSSTKVEIRSRNDDVRAFLRQNLAAQTQLSRWIEEAPNFGTTIVGSIIEKISGMFLLARLYRETSYRSRASAA